MGAKRTVKKRSRQFGEMKLTQDDPLYMIFEHHLFNYKDEEMDRTAFVEAVVNEYITFLRRKKIAVPHSMEHAVKSELGVQVKTLLMKRIYGCLTIGEFQQSVLPEARDYAQVRYQKLKDGRSR